MMRFTRVPVLIVAAVGLAWALGTVQAAQLPQDHEYQRQLRAYMAGLTEKDFDVQDLPFRLPADYRPDKDEQCSLWVLSTLVPTTGGLRVPSSCFTLKALEADPAVAAPPADPLPLAWLAGWNHPCNPYHGSAAVKRRAFVVAALDMIMHDGLHERSPGRNWVLHGLQEGKREGRAAHSDCLGGSLIWIAYAYAQCRDAVPAPGAEAYATGLKKLVRRLDEWGPASLMTDMDMFAAVALTYVKQQIPDLDIQRIADTYVRTLLTDPRYTHPAGYWVDIQGYDASYEGISFYFANWAALASNLDFADEAVRRGYRLRSHMSLPEPQGGYSGPTHFSPRTSADSYNDQWNYYHRNVAGAIVTDEAVHLVKIPSDEEIAAAPAKVVQQLNAGRQGSDKGQMGTWSENHWRTTQFNYGYTHYRKGFYERLRKLQADKSPMLVPAWQRPEQFVRNFGDAFLVAKFADYGVIVHTGPVGEVEPAWPTRAQWMPMDKPFGFSGGALSAFWTPQGGSVLLGRRGGAQGGVYDKYEEWRLWPFSAVTGQTIYGKTLTSGRILQPEVHYEVGKAQATVTARGVIPQDYVGQCRVMNDIIHYDRAFHVEAAGVTIRTELRCEPTYRLAELCETLPVHLDAEVTIEFQVGDQWRAAGTEYSDGVRAARVRRSAGAVLISFAEPRRVKLSPQVWQDQYQSSARCRTILVDLMPGAGKPFAGAAVAYQIAPERK